MDKEYVSLNLSGKVLGANQRNGPHYLDMELVYQPYSCIGMGYLAVGGDSSKK